MAYTRGDHYVWSDGERLHLWARDGYDGWDDSVWHEGDSGGRAEGGPSGVAVPERLAEEVAVMLVAELVATGRLSAVVDRAIERWEGNFGCCALMEVGGRLKALDEPR
jgi:hypothetical protein